MPASYEETFDFRLKFGKGAIERLPPGIEYDPPRGAQRLQFEADGFADATPDAVADNSFTEGFGGGETQMRTGFRHGESESCE